MSRPAHRHRLAIEFSLLFLGLPLLAWSQGALLRRWIIPELVLLGLACMLVLWRDPGFDRRALYAWPIGLRYHLVRGGALFLAGASLLLAWAAWSGDVALF